MSAVESTSSGATSSAVPQGSVATSTADIGVDDTFVLEEKEQIVLVLCGLIASGKSTFAESLQEHMPQFRRCNQDDLGDRRAVEQLARQSLSEGFSVCIDRTNFNPAQRSYWIEIAREFPGTKIWVIVFDSPYEVCATRLQYRQNHPTITTPELGLQVLERFATDFGHPKPQEGYDRILYVKPSDHDDTPSYTLAQVQRVLKRVYDSPNLNPNGRFPQPQRAGWQSPTRGTTQQSNRGQWRGRWGTAQTLLVPNRGGREGVGGGGGRGRWGGRGVNSGQPAGWQHPPPYRGHTHLVGLNKMGQSPQGRESREHASQTAIQSGGGSAACHKEPGRAETETVRDTSRID